MSFLAPQFLWLLLALPVVVALHFVRSRRKRLDVSALFLWRQAAQLAERRRRFSPTWLLALQLLFVSLAALALAQPSFNVGGAPERVLIVDASASMAARDGGSTRLERAKAEAADLLAGAGRVAVLRAGLDATVAQPLSSDRGAVRRTLQDLTAADASADLQRALDLAASVAPGAELHLFSDDLAGVVEPPGSALTFHPAVQLDQTDVPLQSPANWGVSAFDLRNQQIFVSVVSNARRPQEVTLSVTRDGTGEDRPVAQTSLLVPSQGQANTSFPVEDMTGFYRAVIEVPSEDALDLDNEAFAGSRTLGVVVTPPTPRIERVLRILPGVEVRSVRSLPEGEGALEYDVLISSNPPPETLAPGRYLFFRAPSEEPRYAQIADWDRSDPLLRFVDLTGVTVGLPPEDAEAAPLPAGDWRTLAQTSDLSPALLRLSEPGVEAALLRFHPSQTDLVRRVAFPILMTNLMDAFRGEPRLPLGAPLSVDGGNAGERATEPGVYTVGGAPYSVSLLSAAESRLETSLPTALSTQSGAANPPEEATERRNLGLWLTLTALLVLVGEWLLWSRGGGGGWARA